MTSATIPIGTPSLDRSNAQKVLVHLTHSFDRLAALGHAPERVTVDLGGLSYMDAAGGRCLLDFWAYIAQSSETALSLANVSAATRPTIERCKLDHLFTLNGFHA
jgi:anti-anti-sigma factor